MALTLLSLCLGCIEMRPTGVMSASSSASTEQPISLETLDYQTSGLARWSNTLRGLQQEHFLEHLYSSQ